MDTHYLDLRIGIDSIDLVKEGNIEGAKVALGCRKMRMFYRNFVICLQKKLELPSVSFQM